MSLKYRLNQITGFLAALALLIACLLVLPGTLVGLATRLGLPFSWWLVAFVPGVAVGGWLMSKFCQWESKRTMRRILEREAARAAASRRRPKAS